MPVAATEAEIASPQGSARTSAPRLNHLRLLEAESIHILREVASEFERPVMLYSIGKDSSVMLRLAQKAFYPAPIPFPLLHIDTGFKFAEMLDVPRRNGAVKSARSCWCGATSRPSPPEPIPSLSTPSAAAGC